MSTTLAITSTYYQSPLGLLRIGGTDTYISEISFVDHLEDSDYKQTGMQGPVTPMVIQCIEQLIQYFQGQRRIFEFPVAQEGTPFQLRVWNELTAIPYGKTLSYLDLSRRLGDTKAIRAAASANGRNKFAIVVPCHRVNVAVFTLGGFNGGFGARPRAVVCAVQFDQMDQHQVWPVGFDDELAGRRQALVHAAVFFKVWAK